MTHFRLCARPQRSCGHQRVAVRCSNFVYYRNKNFVGSCPFRNPFRSVRAYEPAMPDRISQPDIRAAEGEILKLYFTLKLENAILPVVKAIRLQDSMWEPAGKLKTNLRSRAFGNLNGRRDFLIDEEVKDGLRTFVSFVYFDVYYDK